MVDTEPNMKDKGMKWVIIADVMAVIVVGLFLWASYIDREVERQELEAVVHLMVAHLVVPVALGAAELRGR